MKRFFICFSLFSLIMCPRGFADKIKEPNVSGQFYESDPGRLTERIDTYLSQAKVEPSADKIEALISPHAGYMYSGPVAAYAYKSISGKSYRTVVIIAASHYYGFDGVSVWQEGGFRTPLGVVPVDQDFAGRLIAADKKFSFQPQFFDQEHSLEVQLPFLQRVLKDFKIVPVIMGQASFATAQRLAEALNQIIGRREDVLVVVSSDMSHYHPGNEAQAMDQMSLKLIEVMDIQGFWTQCSLRKLEMCGFIPVTTGMIFAEQRGLKPKILHYANSGDVTGDYSRVVGYGAVIFSPMTGPGGATGVAPLTQEQKKALLTVARQTIEQYLKERKVYDPQVKDSRLLVEEGAFVTLHKDGQLRGCIGRVVGPGPLFLTVRDMAIAAATEDPRFNPVSEAELKDIEIEISVLSQPWVVRDPQEIQPGVHGVIVKRGFRQGIFLPQVATEWNWGREEFLSNLCSHKAGLPPDAWKDPQTRLEVFTANVFSEKDIK
jgi:MEMO1 family protein